jgi:hypothetical protein
MLVRQKENPSITLGLPVLLMPTLTQTLRNRYIDAA